MREVRSQKSGVRIFALALIAASISAAQAPSPLLNAVQMNQLCQRTVQLMDAGGIAVPDLKRAAEPVLESARQSCVALEAKPGTTQPVFALMNSLKAFLTLSDAVPKPFPFPETAQKQLAELRDDETRLDTHFRALLDAKEARLANPDRDNLKRYAEDNRKLGVPDPAKPRVIFYGDSITDLWRLNEYFPGRPFVNRGIGGQITGEMLGRLKADVIDLRPSAVVILAGTNDLARGIPLTRIEDNLLMIGDLCDTYKIKVIFASVLPVSDYHKADNKSYERTPDRPPVFIKALNEWIQSFCANRHHTYLDYWSAMVDSKGELKEDLADDGLHPNAKGYRIMAPLALDAIAKALPPRAAPPTTEKPAKKRGTSNN
ncbi:MAG TPA: GDSL-type esterase/lipase family protein [Bryobacteraceae bacterium]|nr:GDSL-type esterase/lipase family protein [Bryobacteraceae bacterium]